MSKLYVDCINLIIRFYQIFFLYIKIFDHDGLIININARYPGSCHDSYVWANSKILSAFQTEFNGVENQKFWLLGDSGYPLQPWLMTPFRAPASDNEILFNNLHTRIRSGVERNIGEWKNRFRLD